MSPSLSKVASQATQRPRHTVTEVGIDVYPKANVHEMEGLGSEVQGGGGGRKRGKEEGGMKGAAQGGRERRKETS